MKAKLILIGGVSRSGKSTLAGELTSLLTNCISLSQDNFVLAKEQIPTIKNRIDWEEPKSINWTSLIDRIDELSKHHSFIIIEGIFAFNSSIINDLAVYKVYLELDYELFTERRKDEKRWGPEPAWYLEHVWNAHEKFANPYQIEFQTCCPYSTSLAQEIFESLT